jgi:hypothetical protein
MRCFTNLTRENLAIWFCGASAIDSSELVIAPRPRLWQLGQKLGAFRLTARTQIALNAVPANPACHLKRDSHDFLLAVTLATLPKEIPGAALLGHD